MLEVLLKGLRKFGDGQAGYSAADAVAFQIATASECRYRWLLAMGSNKRRLSAGHKDASQRARLPANNKTGLPRVGFAISEPSPPCQAHATILRTNSGSSCRWLRMIPSLGTNAATDPLPGSGCVRVARRTRPAIDPRLSTSRIHTAGRWNCRLQEPSPRLLALAQKSASVRDNWFSQLQ